MGSMAEAANSPEKETETVAVEGMVSLPASVPASVPAVNPKSPVEVREDQVDTEVDLTVQEPPEKRACKSLEDELSKLMERTREGYDLTAAALEKVQQHLDISRQLGQDLTQLAQEVHCDKVGAKYQLAQLQQVLSSFQNLEWQVGGSKQESHTSIKAIANKLLAAATTSKEALKSIHAELREGNEKVIQAINDGFEKLAAAFQATSLPGKEAAGAGFPPGFPPVPSPSVAPPSVAPPAAPPVAPSATAMYGMPGYASSYAAAPPNTPQTPAVVPKAPVASSISMPPAPTGGAAGSNQQPPQPLVLMVAGESGQPRRAAVSPTRHLPGSKLSGTYLNEFGLGCIHHAGGFHRRLPDVFLPK